MNNFIAGLPEMSNPDRGVEQYFHFAERRLGTSLMLHQALHLRIDEVDFEQAKADVKPFLTNVEALEIWSGEYFHQLVNNVAGVNP